MRMPVRASRISLTQNVKGPVLTLHYKQKYNVILCFKLLNLTPRQDYVAAMEDFQQSLELKKNQPIAMLYKGLTFFHRGMLKVTSTTDASVCCFYT